MKNLKKLWGSLISLVIVSAVGLWVGIDRMGEYQTDKSNYTAPTTETKSSITTSDTADFFESEDSSETQTEKSESSPSVIRTEPSDSNDSTQQTKNRFTRAEDLEPVGNNEGPQVLGTATFNKSELSDKNGWIDYHKLDHLGRPTGADALLKKSMINTGTSANREIRPPGFISGPKYDHSRGHLIAKQFGGSGDEPKNLVTLYQYPVNDPYMNYYELMIRRALNQGETVRYRVTPHYVENELIPESIELEAKGLSQNTIIDFTVLIPNKK